jgi:hypothetical protein
MICLCPLYGAKASFDAQSMMAGSPPTWAVRCADPERRLSPGTAVIEPASPGRLKPTLSRPLDTALSFQIAPNAAHQISATKLPKQVGGFNPGEHYLKTHHPSV